MYKHIKWSGSAHRLGRMLATDDGHLVGPEGAESTDVEAARVVQKIVTGQCGVA